MLFTAGRRLSSMQSRFFAVAFMVLGAAGPVAAQTFDLEVVPRNPHILDSVTVVATVVSGNTYALGAVTTQSNGELVIEVDFEGPCLVTCPETEQTFEVPLGSLDAGYHHVDLVSRGEVRSELLIIVAEEVDHSHDMSLQIHPGSPDDNDRLWATIPWTTVPCIHGSLYLHRIEEEDGERRIVVRTNRTTNPPPCPGIAPEKRSLLVDLGRAPAGDFQARLWLEEKVDNEPFSAPIPIAGVDLRVADADDAVTLLERYRVSATWTTAGGETGAARPVPDPTRESALFTFFEPTNWEVMVKVLDTCAINDHRWVALTLASDLEVELEIVDLENPDQSPWTFLQPLGTLSPATFDIFAFPCSP